MRRDRFTSSRRSCDDRARLFLILIAGGAAAGQEFAGREQLRAHSAEFRREVIAVTRGVWVAVGFSDANSLTPVGCSG